MKKRNSEINEEQEEEDEGEQEEDEQVDEWEDLEGSSNQEEENAKQKLKDLNMSREITSKRLSRLYCAGSDSDLIQSDIHRRERKEVSLNLDRYNSHFNHLNILSELKKDKEVEQQQQQQPYHPKYHPFSMNQSSNDSSNQRIFQMTDSLLHSTKTKYNPPKSTHSEVIYNQNSSGNWKEKVFSKTASRHPTSLRTHTALAMLDHCNQGPYHTSITPISPYQERFEGLPQESSYTSTTPGVWNIEERKQLNESYVQELGQGHTHCSKNISNQGELTSLQSSLIACGRLRTTENQNSQQIESKIQQSILESGIRQSKQHAEWLLGLAPSQQSQLTTLSDHSLHSSLSSNHQTQSQFQSQHQTQLRSKSESHLKQTSQNKLNKHQLTNHSLNTSKQQSVIPTPQKNTKSFPKRSQHIKGSLLENDLESKSPSRFQSTQLSTIDNSTSTSTKHNSQLQSQSHFKSKSNHSYDSDLASHLHTETKDTTNNPFRIKERVSKNPYSAAKSLSTLRTHFVDPKDYSKDNTSMTYGGYTASVKEPYISSNPTANKVNKALVQLSRRMIVSYDTKVVETGAALKALQDLRHPTPGIAAIVDLNRSFCDAASLNPSPWQLSRQQFSQILHEKVPWLDLKAINRLTSAYDPHRSGVVKFVRVSAALMVGNRPAMSILMSQLTRDPDNVDKTGNVFLLRLLHGLYEDCNGGVVEQAISSLDRNSTFGEALNIPKSEGVGIKLEDVSELLSAACTCLEDEIEMQELASEIVQVLFEEGQKKDLASIPSPNSQKDKKRPVTRSTKRDLLLFGESESIQTATDTTTQDQSFDYTIPSFGSDKPLASVVLKHSTLKGVRSIPNVNQNDFVKCITRHPTLMSVFDKQLTRFRELMLPYITKGTMSFEDSLLEKSVYGSRSYY